MSQAKEVLMHPMVRKAEEALQVPEVQEMLKKLSTYGLGVFMPHQHDEESGEFSPLPAGTVQVERNLQVTFEDDTDELRATSSVVGWRWDEGVSRAAACIICMDVQKGHAKFPC